MEGWRALKVLAAEQETTLNALAVEAFNDLLHSTASGSPWKIPSSTDQHHPLSEIPRSAASGGFFLWINMDGEPQELEPVS